MIIAVDPGLSGAIAYLGNDGELMNVFDMPTVTLVRNKKNKKDIDYEKLQGFIGRCSKAATRLVIEKVGSMPGQGVSSMFAFGKATGAILGAAGACGIPIQEIPPATWKKAMQLTGQEKDAARELALRLFDYCPAYFARKKDTGRADAALIGYYATVICKN